MKQGSERKGWAAPALALLSGVTLLVWEVAPPARAQGQPPRPLPEGSEPVEIPEPPEEQEAEQSTPFSPPLLIGGAQAAEPALAASALGNIYAVWVGWDANDPTCTDNIYFARSTDNGQSFWTPLSLSQGGCEANVSSPDIAVDTGGNIYVVWDRFEGWPNQVWLARSTDGGATFGTPENISNNPTTEVGAIEPSVAGGAPGQVYVTWMDWRDDAQLFQTFFSYSTDAGETFSDPVQLSFLGGELFWSSFPRVGADPVTGQVYVGWKHIVEDSSVKLFLRRSEDGGQTFAEPYLLAHSGPRTGLVDLAVDEAGTLYAVWSDSGRGRLRRSRDGGVSFSRKKKVTPPRAGLSAVYAAVAGAADRLYVVWAHVDVRWDVLVRYTRNGGRTFRGKFNASGPLAGPGAHDIGVDAAGNAYVAFEGSNCPEGEPAHCDFNVYFTRSLEPLP